MLCSLLTILLGYNILFPNVLIYILNDNPINAVRGKDGP